MFDVGAMPFHRPSENLSPDIGVRSRQIRRADSAYTEEFILRTLAQLINAGVPIDQIAVRFGVTTRTIFNWRRRLDEKYRDEARKMNPTSFLGESLEFYRTLRSAGMAIFLTAGDSLHAKRVGLEQARAAHNDMHKWLHMAHFYDEVRFRPSDSSSTGDEHALLAQDLAKGAQDILAAYEIIDGELADVSGFDDAMGSDVLGTTVDHDDH